eukprot:gnl/MRDRNA2_/MRDRNA2_390628_c0_seq1.p1 gnl/MRDRNA2_/MRDRNA2_390628_c0~~gnl/MRDRNA2_/MRDRNA2_390628_c0_seq1.p1  ORF type:complete len:186 (-),score=9.64 gnl/MRDRNA2_/MRDRNA2_390628_c0_seq1:18-575(-)
MWELFLFLPQHESDGMHEKDREAQEDQLVIQSFSKRHRAFLIFVVGVPRTAIAVLVAIVGTTLLLHTTSYLDAIMNNLALTFIVEIDTIIYAGVVAQRRKDLLNRVSPISVASPITDASQYLEETCSTTSTSIILAVVVICVSLCCCIYARERELGWVYVGEAVRCFCNLEGPSCISMYEFTRTP